MLKIFTFITQHESPEQFLLQIKTIVSEVLFLMMEIVQLYYLSHKPILQGLENGRQNAKDFFNGRWLLCNKYSCSTYDKAISNYLFEYPMWFIKLAASGSQFLC